MALLVICSSIALSFLTGVYIMAICVPFIVVSIIAPFFDVPSLRKSGKVKYYSSLFLAEKPKNGSVTIHGGTLFDYYFVLEREMSGAQRTRYILHQYVSGLLALMEEYESEPQMKVRGTSYIVNKRTAEKIGFAVVYTDFLQRIILTFNYFNISVANSIAKKRLFFPRIRRTTTYEASIGDLLEKKQIILKLNDLLKEGSELGSGVL